MELDYRCHECNKDVMLVPTSLERSSGKSGCLRWKSTAICNKCGTKLFRLVYKDKIKEIFGKVKHAHKIEIQWKNEKEANKNEKTI